ncbi:MAG: adenine nucleotide alpha hydrolase family protein [Candidatus Helarchaeota archaeon]|nr:adenine nucleotide alpha hydrolase family protein [Candidatus Helarchaeota archaeon]
MKCKICKETANIKLDYCGLKLCKPHFIEYIQKRAKRTIKRYQMVRREDKIAVALSGGKDSQTLIHILKQLYMDSNPLIGIHIDLGIDNYSQESAKFVRILCDELEVPVQIINIEKEYNFTIDMVKNNKKIKRPICSNCGLVKRYVLNAFAKKFGVNVLATGHVLDDEVSILLSNLVNGNFEQLIRGGPFLPSTDVSMIARAKPLYEISELETTLYAHFNNISFIGTPCPYDVNATVSSYKEITNKLEENQPGSRYLLLRNYVKIYKKAFKTYNIEKQQEILHCNVCGGPTIRNVCAFCSLRKKMEGNE